MHKPVVEELKGLVDQSNDSPRLDAVSPGPKSAIFQPLSKTNVFKVQLQEPVQVSCKLY